MQTYNSEQFMKLLVCACPNTYHDKAHEEPNEYIVWTELGENSFRAEGVDEYAERYSVTVYTKEEFSEIPENCGIFSQKLTMHLKIQQSISTRKQITE